MTDTTPDRFLSVRDVAALVGTSTATARRMAKAPDFPPAFAPTRRTLRWRAADVAAWIAANTRKPARAAA